MGRCRAKVSSYHVGFHIDPSIPAAVSDEVRRETVIARRAYPIETPVCGRPLVRTVVSGAARGGAAANTVSRGHGRFTIHVWTGGAPWRSAPADLRPLILLHEWYHVVQFSFLECDGRSGACVPGVRPPSWLMEGSAQFEAERIGGAIGIGGGFPERRAAEIREAATVAEPLRKIGRVSGAEYGLAFAAVELLVARSAQGSLDRFWGRAARSGRWRGAFAAAFGSTARAFGSAFERYRANGYRP